MTAVARLLAKRLDPLAPQDSHFVRAGLLLTRKAIVAQERIGAERIWRAIRPDRNNLVHWRSTGGIETPRLRLSGCRRIEDRLHSDCRSNCGKSCAEAHTSPILISAYSWHDLRPDFDSSQPGSVIAEGLFAGLRVVKLISKPRRKNWRGINY